MTKQIKIDLHTHPFEELKKQMGIRGIGDINKDVIQHIVQSIKQAGINGIAITEHNNFNYGLVASMQIMDLFPHENLFIFPGVEIENQGQHYLQIYIPDYLRKRIPFFQGKEWLIALAHPGYYSPLDTNSLSGLKIDLIESQNNLGEFPVAQKLASEIAIPLFESSNAHTLKDIGKRFISLEYQGR